MVGKDLGSSLLKIDGLLTVRKRSAQFSTNAYQRQLLCFFYKKILILFLKMMNVQMNYGRKITQGHVSRDLPK
jgi:hypothetical protein